MEQRVDIRAISLIAHAVRDLLRPPFVVLLALEALVTLVGGTVAAQDAPALVMSLILLVVSIYVDIALVLAAAQPGASASADHWIRAAFARRVFWRYLLAGAIALLSVVAGALLLVVGAFIVAARVGLAQPAAALERRRAFDAVGRSVEISRPARAAVAVVFTTLVILPTAAAQAAAYVASDAVQRVVALVAIFLLSAGTIALTRAFVALGGEREPTGDPGRA